MPVHNSFTLLLAESKVEGLFHNQKKPAHFKVCTVSFTALMVDDSICKWLEASGAVCSMGSSLVQTLECWCIGFGFK